MAGQTAESVLEVFRRFDVKGEGTISCEKLSVVLRGLDSSKWAEENVAKLMEGTEPFNTDGAVRYEEFIRWVMASSAADGCAAPASVGVPDPICQAALDGNVESLRLLLGGSNEAASAASGYVEVDGNVVGLWTMGFDSFQLKTLAETPELKRASALHYAAFTGKADAIRYLIFECGMDKADEGVFGWSPTAISAWHRLGLDNTIIEADEEAQKLLQEDGVLCDQDFQKEFAKIQSPVAAR
eukprot:TRINITY_DN74742_c0_g1_i1.p1 TRINITY_DN74742_c0_g1~~TRINITY_DN74742_c0_g1_i1.p1  ORF type:complete len:241 (-),score=56.60 TRINITY_DN74742_c0_g1_i1:56-778(-)